MLRHTIYFSLLLAFLVSCGSSAPVEEVKDKVAYTKLSGNAFGTMYNVICEVENGTTLRAEIDSVLANFDASLSTYNSKSLIAKINRGEKVQVDSFFRAVFAEAYAISEATNGEFDVTIAPVVNAWGFGFTKKEEVNSKQIDSLLQFVGYKKVSIKDGFVARTQDKVMFDFNAIAKGYGVDVVADYLRKQGFVNFLVEIGGEIVAQGKNSKHKNWSVGVDKPVDNAALGANLQAIVRFTDKALATSGNYRRFYMKDGIKYAHTIDPKTGYPVQHSLLSATVVASSCMRADGYATAFMVMGLDKAKDFLAQHPELDALLIYSDEKGNYRVWQTEGMSNMIEPLEK